jgi:hypothetical protein
MRYVIYSHPSSPRARQCRREADWGFLRVRVSNTIRVYIRVRVRVEIRVRVRGAIRAM